MRTTWWCISIEINYIHVVSLTGPCEISNFQTHIKGRYLGHVRWFYAEWFQTSLMISQCSNNITVIQYITPWHHWAIKGKWHVHGPQLGQNPQIYITTAKLIIINRFLYGCQLVKLHDYQEYSIYTQAANTYLRNIMNILTDLWHNMASNRGQ